MKLFMVLATVFYGGTIWVGADYYIQVRAPPMVTTVRGETVKTNYLYECRGFPTGTSAYTAVVSRCTQVTSWEQKINIYFNCNFYSVYRPNLRNHVIRLPDHTFRLTTEWSVGYLHRAIDHPDFAAPSQAVLISFRTKVDQLGVDIIVPSEWVDDLTCYFTQNNLISLAEDFTVSLAFFGRFSAFLRRLKEIPAEISRDTIRQRADMSIGRLKRAIKLCLQKMIDPCTVLRVNFPAQANEYCSTYCYFLGFASSHFNTCTSRCSTLQGGRCEGLVCMCRRALSDPFVGCAIISPMRMCHNSLRDELNE